MPQMAPLNWTTLFVTFTIMLMMTNSMNYFIMNSEPSTKSKSMKTFKTNWKW